MLLSLYGALHDEQLFGVGGGGSGGSFPAEFFSYLFVHTLARHIKNSLDI